MSRVRIVRVIDVAIHRFSRHHNASQVGVGPGYERHNGGVGDDQIVDGVTAAELIDDRTGVFFGSHFDCAAGMVAAGRKFANQCVQARCVKAPGRIRKDNGINHVRQGSGLSKP